MTTQQARLVAIVRARMLRPETRHSIGRPMKLAGALEVHQLPPADVLLIEQDGPASVFLYRWTRFGEFGGDTHHTSIDEAKHQADFEFGAAVDAWIPVPEDVADAREFAIRVCRDGESTRSRS